MGVTPITSHAEFKRIIAQDKFVIIDFWATWCGPCKMISPVLEQLSGQYGHVEFYKVDVDEQPDISTEVGIRAMPTFIIFKNGEKIEQMTGANPQGLTALLAKTN